MRVLFPISGPGLQFPIDPRFGRAPFFAIVETDDPSNPEILQNPYAFYPSAAGIAAAQLALQKGVQAVVAPAVGPNASMVLASAGIRVIPAFGMKTDDVLKSIIEGNIPQAGFTPWSPVGEEEYLRGQISSLENQLNQLKQRLEEIEKSKEEK